MKELIMQDELAMCADALKKNFKSMHKTLSTKEYKDVFFLGDDNFLCDYLLRAVCANNEACPAFRRTAYVRTGRESDYRRETLREIPDVVDMADVTVDNRAGSSFLFFIDCVDGLADKQTTLTALEDTFSLMRGSKKADCVISVLLPETPVFSTDIKALSEREYSFYIENNCPRTPEIEYYLAVEALCRQAVAQDGLAITLLRFDNVFAPDRLHTPAFDLVAMLKECHQQSQVCITAEDCRLVSTLTYVRTACSAVFSAMSKARRGHVYNVADAEVSVRELKQMLHAAAPSAFSLHTDIPADVQPSYSSLSTLKFRKTGFNLPSQLDTGIAHLVSYVAGTEYDTSANVSFYNGKIKNIQALEIKILQQIDAICRENDIQYFLAGGSLLGAVRSGSSIPWDDDLDIGMLREDFEKFRKLCPVKLCPEFSYSSPDNTSGSHYTIDKIRLDDTYFSTNYSGKNSFPDGVFVDILVYDKTSNSKLGQKLHAFILTALTHTILIKWYGVARRNFHYRFSRLMLPILRIIPWPVFHGVFDFFAKLYRHKKNAKWLIDTVGKKVNDGPLPNEGLDKVVYVEFDGVQAPIPVDPAPYLTYAYGPGYMEKPPLSKRSCPHNFSRIDLGKFVFDVQEQRTFRRVDVRGELYESEERIL